MKGTDHFKEVIEGYLKDMSKKDLLFMRTLKNPNKNIDDCVTYILNAVQKSGCNGFSDDEIYGMAVHYYSEDNIDVGKKSSGNVVINRQIELTEEEKKELHDKAREQVLKEEMDKIRGKGKKKIPVITKPSAPNDDLFGAMEVIHDEEE